MNKTKSYNENRDCKGNEFLCAEATE